MELARATDGAEEAQQHNRAALARLRCGGIPAVAAPRCTHCVLAAAVAAACLYVWQGGGL